MVMPASCVFRVFGIDQNGFVDFKKYMLSIDVIVRGTPEEKVKWAFQLYDVYENGIIDPSVTIEVVQMCKPSLQE